MFKDFFNNVISSMSLKQIMGWTFIFLIGLVFGYFLTRSHTNPVGFTGTQLRDKTSNYAFISPLLACKSPDKNLFLEYKNLEIQLQELADKATRQKQVADLAVYFRDMQTGHWTGINENRQFFPASLLKVPIMIALFKEAESKPKILNRRIQYRQVEPTSADKDTGSTTTQLRLGQNYTVNELIRAMIIDSDNNAKELLLDIVNFDVFIEIFNQLEMDVPGLEDEGEVYGVSARQYSLMFRILYNATYLDEEMSNRALDLLSQVSFKAGLTAKLPATLKIAHKFGIKGEATEEKELHDCGIVYAPKGDYFVCVMTRGENFDNLSVVISKVSLLVYNYVNSLPAPKLAQ